MPYISKRKFLKFLSNQKACKAGVDRAKFMLRKRSVRQMLILYHQKYEMNDLSVFWGYRAQDFEWLAFKLKLVDNNPLNLQNYNVAVADQMINKMLKSKRRYNVYF